MQFDEFSGILAFEWYQVRLVLDLVTAPEA
jgi:hypothetical protein